MDIQSKKVDEIIEEISERYGLHKSTIRMIIMTQFEKVKDVMRSVDSYNNFFPYIRLPYLCVFKIKEGKKKFFIEKSKKLIEDVYSQGQQGDNRAEDAPDT